MSFLIVILLIALTFSTFLIIGIRQYYLTNIGDIIRRQAETAGKIFAYHVSNLQGAYSGPIQGGQVGQPFEYSIYKDAGRLFRSFAQLSAAELQLYDGDGDLINEMGNIVTFGDVPTDVAAALTGKAAIWTGRISETNEPVMAATQPLIQNERVVAVVRYVTSLREVEKIVNRFTVFIITFASFVSLVAVLISILLSNTIVSPVRDLTGVAQMMAGGRLDIRAKRYYNDEIGKLSDTLNYMAEELLKQDKLKNEFIALVSHELRTPLTSIKGWAYTLKAEETSPEELAEGMDIIDKECSRLTFLVEELLDFSKLAAGKTVLNKTEVDINSLLKNTISQMKPRSERMGIQLELESFPIVYKTSADPDRLKQVIVNVIDNALKFTESGGSIKASVYGSDSEIFISIRDNGCGIPSEDLPLIKGRFYKSKHNKEGSGLGLSICEEIMNLHGGRLEIESTKGLGTIVKIILPT